MKSPEHCGSGLSFLRDLSFGLLAAAAHMGSCPLRILLLALGALAIHRPGLEAAFFQPLHDPVFREAEVRFHPQIRYLRLIEQGGDVPQVLRVHI